MMTRTKPLFHLLALRVLLVLLAVALVAMGPVTAEEDSDSSPKLRVISCAPNLTEILFAIGAGDQIVAVDNYSAYPVEAQELPRTGDLFSPDLEAIARFEPDVIATVPSNRAVRDYFSRQQGVEVVECGDGNTLASIRKTVLQLADATGREEGARALLRRHEFVFEQVDHTVLDFIRRARQAPTRAIVLFGRTPGELRRPWGVHPKTYLGEMLNTLRIVNVVDESLPPYAEVDVETIVRWTPDVIVEVQSLAEGEDTPEARAERAAALAADWFSLRPYMKEESRPRHVVLWGSGITIPGARVDQTLCEFAVALRPHLFPQASGMALWDELVAMMPGSEANPVLDDNEAAAQLTPKERVRFLGSPPANAADDGEKPGGK